MLPTVTTSGLATLPMHRALVDDAHAIVEHSAEPSRPDGVKSPNAKFNPTTDKLLLTCEAAVLIRESRALMTGAASEADRVHNQPFHIDFMITVAPANGKSNQTDASELATAPHDLAIANRRSIQAYRQM